MEDNKRKARFHEVMAEHYANGGSVNGDQIFFGHENFLSQDGEDMAPAGKEMDDEMGDMKEHDAEKSAVDHDMMAMRKKRLMGVRMGK